MPFEKQWTSRFCVSALLAAAITGLTVTAAPAWQAPAPVTPGPPSSVELTVYNQDLGLVKETRPLSLTVGLNEVRYTDVAAQIDPTSVHFTSTTAPTTTSVLEQNFEYDLVGPEKLLQKYVDQKIDVVTQDGTAYSGTLLNGGSDIILMADNGQVTILRRDQVRTLSFPALPDGLITRPTLVWTVSTDRAGLHNTDVTYLTHGISWQANYVLLLAEDEKTMDLNGWVTLNNQSGAAYRNAHLKLVAGTIAQAQTAPPQVVYEYADGAARAAPAPQVSERGFFEYHLYEVNRPVTVSDNQTKQIEFVGGSGITTTKFFVYDGSGVTYSGYGPVYDQNYGLGSNTTVKTMLEFTTGKASNLDVALPAGVVRMFKRDVDGVPLLIGENNIDHTPKDEKVRLYVGDAFDIVAERTQTDFKRLGDKTVEESFKIVVRNHNATAVDVRVVEHLYRWSQWEIVNASDKSFSKLDAQTIEWRLPVAADGESEITYTVRYSF